MTDQRESVYVDDMPGETDDEKIAAAIRDADGREVVFSRRTYTIKQPFPGSHIRFRME